MRAGVDQTVLQIYDTRIGSMEDLMGIEDLEHWVSTPLEDPEGYVFFPLIPGYRTLCIRYGVLGSAFRARGYQPVFLYDDDDLPVRPGLTINDQNTEQTAIYRYRARRLPEICGFDSVSIGGCLREADAITNLEERVNTLEERNIPVSDAAAASTRKFLKKYTLDMGDERTERMYQRFLHAGVMMAEATSQVLSEYEIVATVGHEVNYIQGRIPLQMSHNDGIPAFGQSKGYFDDTIRFGRAENRWPTSSFTATEVTRRAIETELTEEERDELEKRVQEWRSGGLSRVYVSKGKPSISDPESAVIGLFTNLLWDGALEPHQALYDDVYEWIDETISELGGRGDVRLIIKPHPAEAARGTNESVTNYLETAYGSLPGNVRLLDPDTDINTYALLEELDAAIVYASTVGIEASYDGVPAITAGYPPYRGFDITYDPETKEAYKQLLTDIESLDCGSRRQSRAERFLHLLFVCKHIDFSGVDTRQSAPLTASDLGPGNEPFDTIVNQITDDREVLAPVCDRLYE